MQSQIENYRTKAREFARLAAVAKSRRDARHCRKFADIIGRSRWATNRCASSLHKSRRHTSLRSERSDPLS